MRSFTYAEAQRWYWWRPRARQSSGLSSQPRSCEIVSAHRLVHQRHDTPNFGRLNNIRRTHFSKTPISIRVLTTGVVAILTQLCSQATSHGDCTRRSTSVNISRTRMRSASSPSSVLGSKFRSASRSRVEDDMINKSRFAD